MAVSQDFLILKTMEIAWQNIGRRFHVILRYYPLR
jgi:hypothetical protein